MGEILNFTAVIVATFVPLLVGFIWYHPKVMGTAWMKTSGLTEEQLKSGNRLLIAALVFIFSAFVAITLITATIHQVHFYSTLANDPTLHKEGSELYNYSKDFMTKYGNNFRSFGHGALHGGILSLFLVFPVIAINALLERKSWKYIFIHVGYWTISMGIMGALICGWR
jgi:hypothetical protein